MFDPRDDARDRDAREDGRARVYDERERDDDDSREGLMRDLDLPRGEERELVALRDRVYELDGEDSRTLAAVGAFRVVPEHDLDIPVLLHPIELVFNAEVGKLDRAVEVRQVVFARPLFDFARVTIRPSVAVGPATVVRLQPLLVLALEVGVEDDAVDVGTLLA